MGGTGTDPFTVNDPITTEGIRIAKWSLNGKELAYGRTVDGRVDARQSGALGAASTGATGAVPSQWIAWGGSLGVRFLTNLITFKTVLLTFQPGENPTINFSGSTSSEAHPRLIVYDDSGMANDDLNPFSLVTQVDNLIQCIPLPFPAIQGFRLPQNPGPEAELCSMTGCERREPRDGVWWHHPGRRYRAIARAHPRGFRLIAAKRIGINGRAPSLSQGQITPFRYPLFVPHPDWGQRPLAHRFPRAA